MANERRRGNFIGGPPPRVGFGGSEGGVVGVDTGTLGGQGTRDLRRGGRSPVVGGETWLSGCPRRILLDDGLLGGVRTVVLVGFSFAVGLAGEIIHGRKEGEMGNVEEYISREGHMVRSQEWTQGQE